jgi:hypothetical protein
LLELFKKQTFFSILLLIPYTIILHAVSWFKHVPASYPENCWIFSSIFTSFKLSYQSETILAIFFIFIQAVLIARLSSKYKLNPDGQVYASIVFILFCGFSNITLGLNAAMIANTFLILAIFEIFGIYFRKEVGIPHFNFGLLIGLASILYPPYYVFILLGIMSIIILRGTRIIEFLQVFGGFINVYLLTFTVLYLTNTEDVFFRNQISGFFEPYMFSMNYGDKGWIALILVCLFMAICILNYQYFQSKRSIIYQKQYDIVFWALLIGTFSIFFVEIDKVYHLYIFFTPLALLTGVLLTRIKNPLIQETLHLFLMITALFLQFQNW